LIIFEYFPQIFIFFDFFTMICPVFRNASEQNLRILCEEHKTESEFILNADYTDSVFKITDGQVTATNRLSLKRKRVEFW